MTVSFNNFRKTLLYSVQKPPLKILEDFAKFKAIAKINQAKRKKITIYILVSFLGLISLLPIFNFLSYSLQNHLDVVLIIIIFLGSVIIINILYWIFTLAKYPGLNLDCSHYQLFEKIVRLINRDMAEQSLLLTKIDFTKSMEKNKIISTVDHPYKRRFKITTYQNPWLNLEGKFRDSTKFQLNCTEYNQKVYGHKKSRSGKSKYKSKTKFKGLEIKLKLAYPNRKYGAIQVFKEDAIGAIKLPPNAQIKNLKITSKYIQLTVKLLSLNREVTYQTVVMMFLSLYQILNLARKLSKSNSSQ